ncbi:MAG: ClpXP protease specificity-enhancing factor SspB [Pseudomonadota bacterium]|nr:ClpXP protease specificity-enhancing factor SspB [Pseudomonadota bacterium]
MNYQALVDNALRGVVRDTLQRVAEEGLPGEHHLYITFQTQHSGVEIASRLAAQYPNEMTIVLQHQFWGLEITEDAFEITLSFSGKNERLLIPFDSVVGFADPSVNFGLHFNAAQKAELPGSSFDAKNPRSFVDPENILTKDVSGDDTSAHDNGDNGDNGDKGDKTGEVVALDAFRKKKT